MGISEEKNEFGEDFRTKCCELNERCKKSRGADGQLDEKVLFRFLNAYIHEIIMYVTDLSQEGVSDVIKEMELAQWLLALTSEDMVNFEAVDYSYHPVSLMNEWYRTLAHKRTRNIYSNDACVTEICDNVIESKYLERKKLDLCIYGKDYKLTVQGKMEPYSSYGSLTEVQDIRIITKVKNMLEKRGAVKVAVFGTLKREEDYFQSYFQNENIVIAEYIFRQEDLFERSNPTHTVNLKNTFDIMELVITYDLILFLDESYFYKPFQSHKSFIEKNYAKYIDVLSQRIASEEMDHLSRINLYYAVYETARKFLACMNTPMSPKYEFDVDLINRFESVIRASDKTVSDVYFYIHNDRIADMRIDTKVVCKEENYDGKNLNVYKINGEKLFQETKTSVSKELKRRNSVKTISVDLWKFIKSVSNQYYTESWKQYPISDLMAIQVLFRIGEKEIACRDDFVVEYTVLDSGSADLLCKAKQFMEGVCRIISGGEEIGCVKRYLINLLSSALLSRADSVECALMSYWIADKEKVVLRYVESGQWGALETANDIMAFAERKQLYTIIDKLNHLMIRDMDQLEMILYIDFKNLYAKDVPDELFKQYIKEIHEVCERLEERGSRLYLCTNVV